MSLHEVIARQLQSERSLRAAVLEDALECYRGGGSLDGEDRIDPRETERERARQWLYGSDHERAWPFSFLAVCEALDLDPQLVRRDVGGG